MKNKSYRLLFIFHSLLITSAGLVRIITRMRWNTVSVIIRVITNSVTGAISRNDLALPRSVNMAIAARLFFCRYRQELLCLCAEIRELADRHGPDDCHSICTDARPSGKDRAKLVQCREDARGIPFRENLEHSSRCSTAQERQTKGISAVETAQGREGRTG